MPVVPAANAPGIRLAPLSTPRQQSRANSATFAGDTQALARVGRGVSNIGLAIDQELEIQQQREDADAVFRAETALRTEYLEYEQRIRTERRGANAKGVAGEFDAWVSERYGHHSQGLATETQKTLFEQSAARLQISAKSTLARFEDRESERAHDEAWAGNKIAAIRMAVSDPSTENVAALSQQIRKANTYQAARQGHTGAWLEAQNTADLTQLHKQAIDSLVDQSPAQAKAYYDMHKSDIAAEDRTIIERVLDKSGKLEAAQDRADEIMALGMDRAQAFASVEKKYKGDEEQALKRELNNRFIVLDSAKAEGQQKAFEAATLAVMQGKRPPNSLIAQMSDGQHAQVLSTQRALARQRKAAATGTKIATNPQLYTRLRTLAADNPAEFVKANLEQYVDRIAQPQLEQLLDLRQSIKDKKPEKVEEFVNWRQQVKQRTQLLGIKEEDAAEFEIAADQALAEATRNNAGKTLNTEQRNQVIDKLLMPGEVKSGRWYWPDADKRYYQVRNKPEAALFEPEVPAADRLLIEEALRSRGKEPTDAEVLRLFKLHKGVQ